MNTDNEYDIAHDDEAPVYVDPEHLVRLGCSTRVRPLPSGAVALTAPHRPTYIVTGRDCTLTVTFPGDAAPTRVDLNATIRRIAGLPPLRSRQTRVWHLLAARIERWALRRWAKLRVNEKTEGQS